MSALLERLVCDEFELMEACQSAAADSHGEERARLLHLAGLCQVHLFDFESTLRALTGRSASYSTCVRRSLRSFGRRTWRDSLEQLMRRCERALEQPLPESLRALIQANSNEKRRWTRPLMPLMDDQQRSA